MDIEWTVQFEICKDCKFASLVEDSPILKYYCEKLYEAMPYLKSFMEEISKPEIITGRSPKIKEKPIFYCPIYQEREKVK